MLLLILQALAAAGRVDLVVLEEALVGRKCLGHQPPWSQVAYHCES
jgi:hypothetical protein